MVLFRFPLLFSLWQWSILLHSQLCLFITAAVSFNNISAKPVVLVCCSKILVCWGCRVSSPSGIDTHLPLRKNLTPGMVKRKRTSSTNDFTARREGIHIKYTLHVRGIIIPCCIVYGKYTARVHVLELRLFRVNPL